MIKAIVFDFDGLIVDTESIEYRVLQELFSEYDATLPFEVWEKVIGAFQEDFDIAGYLEQQIGQSIDQKAFYKKRSEKVFAATEKEEILPGVREVIHQAQKLNMRLALASSSKRTWIDYHLKLLGLEKTFECIWTADDVERVKPDPALYQKAVDCLSVDPEETIAFEDSLNGATAAYRAGLNTVVIPNPMTRKMNVQDVAHYTFHTMENVELEVLKKDIGNNRENSSSQGKKR